MNVRSFSAALMRSTDELSGHGPQGSASSRIYSALRARIISLELEPDTTLVRSELAEAFGVSQSPVREAIQRLEQEGLVISYPQSRTVVSKIDVAHARETQFLRIGVELEVAQTLARARDPALLAPSTRLATISGGSAKAGDRAAVPISTAAAEARSRLRKVVVRVMVGILLECVLP